MKAFLRDGHEVIAVTPPGEYTWKIAEEGIRVINYNVSRKSMNPFIELAVISEIYSLFKK